MMNKLKAKDLSLLQQNFLDFFEEIGIDFTEQNHSGRLLSLSLCDLVGIHNSKKGYDGEDIIDAERAVEALSTLGVEGSVSHGKNMEWVYGFSLEKGKAYQAFKTVKPYIEEAKKREYKIDMPQKPVFDKEKYGKFLELSLKYLGDVCEIA